MNQKHRGRVPVSGVRSLGFTLIELVIVVVLLGILAAFALPRFFAANVDARTAAIKQMEGALVAAVNFAKDRYRISQLTGAQTIQLDGVDVTVLSGGNPTGNAAGIGKAIEYSTTSGFNIDYVTAPVTFTITGYTPAAGSCKVVYTAATAMPDAIVRTSDGC